MNADLQIWDAGRYQLAEGARYVAGRLLFVDILSGRLLEAGHRRGPARTLARLDVPLGAVAPIAGATDRWIAAAGTGIALLSASGTLEWLDRPEDGGAVSTRMNDGACDPHGRFWAGSMAYDNTPGAGSLYRVDPDGSVHRVLDGLTIVNGPAFEATGSTMYVADTPTGRILRCVLDSTGDVIDSDLFVEVPADEGAPDGMTVDDAGRLWAAMWGASRVHCYDTDGGLLTSIELPASQPTSVCFDGGGALFVTTARIDLGSPTDADGALLRVASEVSAPPAREYGAAVQRTSARLLRGE